jgi:DNA processing protein
MNLDSVENATLLAATEVVPSDWRDLAAALEKNGGRRTLLKGSVSESDRDSDLLRYVKKAIDPTRVEHWRRVLGDLRHQSSEIRMISVDHEDYPVLLRRAYGHPPFLFVKGTLDDRDARAVAIVGSRSASSSNLVIARDAAKQLARAGITVVSGLAIGTDSAAHAGALEASGRTIAVVAAGIDQPVSHQTDSGLADRIPSYGAIVSQFRPGSPPARSSFLQRNSVISGLSAMSLIIEASERSGTRNEADHALQQGKRVVLWGPAFQPEGWVGLYAQNPLVRVVSSIDDVLSEAHVAVGEELQVHD